jgi:hypothetical protein
VDIGGLFKLFLIPFAFFFPAIIPIPLPIFVPGEWIDQLIAAVQGLFA